ncbi:nuclear transport factor 2 family protein [Pseudomaricurvus alkylphenolicus]|uniref:nuclear transport factor 2 family protein n=1 Tax=Pseudomaricurvus alkylphenolicus TaxID=1306991 RepID=UPI00141E751B|nr:nuclear transport factor 2 family protein [Pseudomaricurvus alkylphenolicus]NIB44087.1 nuclear transport factor 2 family protein [Pseudomaricurvus alkylphenolicus]
MVIVDQATIESFMHTQVACWNSGDKNGFFNAYQEIAPSGLQIEYVGNPKGDGWPILEGMWSEQRPKITIEEVALIVTGNEAVAHNRNSVNGTDLVIETIEHYLFDDKGAMQVRYFIQQPGE